MTEIITFFLLGGFIGYLIANWPKRKKKTFLIEEVWIETIAGKSVGFNRPIGFVNDIRQAEHIVSRHRDKNYSFTEITHCKFKAVPVGTLVIK
jgi:hypothetical protein